MPCGATGVLLRIGTSCCATTDAAKSASTAAERTQKNRFIHRLLSTGLCQGSVAGMIVICAVTVVDSATCTDVADGANRVRTSGSKYANDSRASHEKSE